MLLWNLPAGPWRPSAAAAEEVLAERVPEVEYIPLDLGGPAATSGWQPRGGSTLFEPFQATVLRNRNHSTGKDWSRFYATMGWLADLPDSERVPLLEDVRSRLDRGTYQR